MTRAGRLGATRALVLALAFGSALACGSTIPAAAHAANATTTAAVGNPSPPASTKAPTTAAGATGAGSAVGGNATGGAARTTGAGTTTYVPDGTRTRSRVPATTAPAPSLPTLGVGQGSLLRRGFERPRARASKHGISALEIVLIALGVVLALGLAAWAAIRRRAHDPHWWLALRHAFAEAGFRASETWAEFADWARLGH